MSFNLVFSEEMIKSEYKKIIDIDYSKEVIKHMKERTNKIQEKNKEYKYLEVDCTELEKEFKDENDKFDVVIDKATLDSIMCKDENGKAKAKEYLEGVCKVLKDNGIFILISYKPYKERMKTIFDSNGVKGLIPQECWAIKKETVTRKISLDNPSDQIYFHYVYKFIKTDPKQEMPADVKLERYPKNEIN